MAQFDTNKQRYNLNNNTLHETSILTHTDGGAVSDVNPWGKQVLLVDDDTVQHTAKNRRKTSQNEVTEFASYVYTKGESYWDELVTGTASATHNPFLAMVDLEVGSTAGDEVIRQTRRVLNYVPGRQNEGSMAVIFGTQTPGIRRRFGVFDLDDGAYIEQEGDNLTCVIRRNTAGGVVENRVVRENWNGDKLDGTGPSGIILDLTKIQLVHIEYEWYGAGQVEFNFIINNNKYSVHQFDHANYVDHSWAAHGQFPIRVELKNVTGVAGTHTFTQGSHSFASEGTTNVLGRHVSVSTPIAGITITTENVFQPLIAIRLKSDRLNAVVRPDIFSGGSLAQQAAFIKIVNGATVTGGTWVSVGPDSPVEYNITGTSVSGGTEVETVYIDAGNAGAQTSLPQYSISQLERSTTTLLGDTPVSFVLEGTKTSAAATKIFASLGFIEVR